MPSSTNWYKEAVAQQYQKRLLDQKPQREFVSNYLCPDPTSVSNAASSMKVIAGILQDQNYGLESKGRVTLQAHDVLNLIRYIRSMEEFLTAQAEQDYEQTRERPKSIYTDK